MAITVQLGSVKKRANSTKRPTNLINYSGEIKSPCSALNPVIVFQMEGDPTSYNYAHISAWDRYYWVTDWTFDRGLWVATMRVDVLASWRDTIGTTNTYILRSASSYNGQIADTAYAPKSRIIQTINGNTNTSGYGWTGAYGAGTFVVGIINGATNTAGCVSYYVFTAGQFRTLCQKLFNDPSDYLDIDPTEISENLQRALVNPYQYIASAMWFPFEVAHGSLLSAVKFGWWQFNNNCYPIAEYGYSLNQLSFVVPQHPQSGSRGLYLNDSPYSRYTLFIPAFGEFEIPAAMLNGCPTISCDIVTDSITGVGTLRVKRTTTSGTEELFYREAQIGVPVQLAGIITGVGGGVLNQVSREILSGSTVTGKILGAVGLADTVGLTLAGLSDQMATVSTSGSNGTISGYYFPPKLTGKFMELADENLAEIGRPLCTTKQINSLSGFVLCRDGDFSGAATAEETAQINTFMTTGFYYE